MQSVTFNRSPGIGGGHFPEETLPLDRFLYQLPTLLMHSVPRPPFPPLSILSEILRSGTQDAGMSGGISWLPFEIDPHAYIEARHGALLLAASSDVSQGPLGRRGAVELAR